MHVFCFLLDLFFRRFQDHGQFCWLCVPRALWVSYKYLSHVAFKVLFSRQWIDTVIAEFLAHKLFRYATNVETKNPPVESYGANPASSSSLEMQQLPQLEAAGLYGIIGHLRLQCFSFYYYFIFSPLIDSSHSRLISQVLLL